MLHQDYTDLLNLDDKLNLTGQVERVGRDAVRLGGFSDIWEGVYAGRKVAVKVIREVGTSRSTLTRRLVRETRAWAKLYHRNVLPLLGFTYGFSAGFLASLVSPWMPLGTACVYLKDKSVHERFRVITEVADGLSYLHRHDVVHGDLKGDNILIGDRGESRLADFGLSKLLTEVNIDTGGSQPTATQTTLGTIRWMARELLNGDARGVNCETDVWAYGMTILELLTCLRPYHDEKTEYVVIVNIMNGKLPMYPGSECGLSEDLWALCLQCWDLNPALRPTMRVMAKRVWELDLRTKLRGQKRRSREEDPPSSSADNSDSNTSTSSRTTSTSTATMDSPRLNKSPKLALLDDEFATGSPGSPMPITRPLPLSPVAQVPTAPSTPRTPVRTHMTPSRARTSLPVSRASTPRTGALVPSPRPRSRSSTANVPVNFQENGAFYGGPAGGHTGGRGGGMGGEQHMVGGGISPGSNGHINPRQLLTAHNSEWDAYPAWHPHRLRNVRTHSAPSSPGDYYGGGEGSAMYPSSGGRSAGAGERASGLEFDPYGGTGTGMGSEPLELGVADGALVSLRSRHTPSPLRQETFGGRHDSGVEFVGHGHGHGGAYEYGHHEHIESPERYYHHPEFVYGSHAHEGSPALLQPHPHSYPSTSTSHHASFRLYDDFLATSALSPVMTPTRESPPRLHDSAFSDILLFNNAFADEPLPFHDIQTPAHNHEPMHFDSHLAYNGNDHHQQPVDFLTIMAASPALSDVTPSETPLHTFHEQHPPGTGNDSPVMDRYDEFVFDEPDLGIGGGLSLFGGVAAEEEPQQDAYAPSGFSFAHSATSPRPGGSSRQTSLGSGSTPRQSPRSPRCTFALRSAPHSPLISPLQSQSPILTNA